MCSDAVSVEKIEYLFGVISRHNYRFNIMFEGKACGFKLGSHTARTAVSTVSACGLDHLVGDGVERVNDPRVGIFSRIIVVIAVDIGKDYKTLSLYEGSNYGRKIIVIAENYFLNLNRVVFVYYRNRAEIKQSAEGIYNVGLAILVLYNVTV